MTGVTLTKKTDYDGDIKGNLLSQYDGSTRLRELVETRAASVQELEDVYYKILQQLHIDNAVGDQLDIIGRRFDCKRKGLSDADYRPIIKAYRMARASNGQAWVIANLISQLVGTAVQYKQMGNAYFMLFYSVAEGSGMGADTLERVEEIVNLARLAGVGCNIWELEGDTWEYDDDGPALDDGMMATEIL